MEDFRLKPYKKDFTYSYTLGAFPSIELFECHPFSVLRVVISDNSVGSEGAEKLTGLANEYNVPIIIDNKALSRVSPKDNVHAICAFNKYTQKLDYNKNHVCLVSPSDMGNLGTILRTLTAFGIFDVALIQPAADIFDPKTVRASMGAVFRMRFEYFNSFEEYQSNCNKNRKFYPFMLGGSNLEKAEMPVGNENYTLVFGNESRGLPNAFFRVGQPVEIVHLKTVDSLNLTIAVGIGIYHFVKHTD